MCLMEQFCRYVNLKHKGDMHHTSSLHECQRGSIAAAYSL